MKKIAIFQDDLNIGGIQKSLINLLNSIDYSENSVDLYLFDDSGQWIDSVNENVNVRLLKPMKRLYKFLPFDFALTKSGYDSVFPDYSYDLAIDFNSYQPWTAACAILIPADKRVMWVHNDVEIKYSEEFKYRILFKAMKGKYKYFEAFACVSTALIESFKHMTGECDKEYYVIPNLIDTDEINSLKDVPNDININDDLMNVCAVGRLCHQKGYDIMVDYFKEAVESRKDLMLYIMGSGPDYDMLNSLVGKYSLEKNIRLLGGCKNPYSIMNKCDAFISTSRYEGQGINILEAKALGLQIIIPKHLEKYVEGICGSDNIVDNLVKLEKKPKIADNLEEYNKKSLAMFNNLC